jgi:RimJ/RimL family protein N-acetyltransferase
VRGLSITAVAEAYLKIAGKWQDHILFQLLNKD